MIKKRRDEKMEQKIFYVIDDEKHRLDQLNEKVKELNSMGWKVESVFCIDETSINGFVCTKIK